MPDVRREYAYIVYCMVWREAAEERNRDARASDGKGENVQRRRSIDFDSLPEVENRELLALLP